MSSFVPAATAEAARWVTGRLDRTGSSVTLVVPTGFEAYARVLHPFEGRNGTVGCAELAAQLGRALHPYAPYDDGLIGDLDEAAVRQFDVELPDEGTLPTTIAQTLAEVLAGHTTTTQECYFAVWDGYAALSPSQGFGAAFEIPGRDMFLYSADVTAAAEQFGSTGTTPPILSYPPNLWWPADQAWCVATEIDFRSTYVGGSSAAIQALVQSDLEAFAVQGNESPPG